MFVECLAEGPIAADCACPEHKVHGFSLCQVAACPSLRDPSPRRAC
jgi:hypothetical protein